MKALSGRDFARLVERHGYVCSASAAVITSTASPEAWSVYRSRFTEASR
jgi:hypothetical protein